MSQKVHFDIDIDFNSGGPQGLEVNISTTLSNADGNTLAGIVDQSPDLGAAIVKAAAAGIAAEITKALERITKEPRIYVPSHLV